LSYLEGTLGSQATQLHCMTTQKGGALRRLFDDT